MYFFFIYFFIYLYVYESNCSWYSVLSGIAYTSFIVEIRINSILPAHVFIEDICLKKNLKFDRMDILLFFIVFF